MSKIDSKTLTKILKWDFEPIDIQIELNNKLNDQIQYCKAEYAQKWIQPQSIEDCLNPDQEGFVLQNYSLNKATERYFLMSKNNINYTELELCQVKYKIESALNFLKEQLPEIHTFIIMMTHRLLVYKNNFEDKGSSSTGDWLGRTILKNIHLETFDQNLIIESLVHESIHHYINIIEFRIPLILDKSILKRRTISKWSGQNIGIHSYLHACFVWYGLYNLYITLNAINPHTDILKKISDCSHGFRQGCSVLSHYKNILSYLNHDYLDTFKIIQEDVIKSFNKKPINSNLKNIYERIAI